MVEGIYKEVLQKYAWEIFKCTIQKMFRKTDKKIWENVELYWQEISEAFLKKIAIKIRKTITKTSLKEIAEEIAEGIYKGLSKECSNTLPN